MEFVNFFWIAICLLINIHMKNIVLVTGGFDPIHSGHISYLQAAKKLGNLLIVGINSDDWLTRKKGRSFMPVNERVQIIENIKAVDGVILFNDSDSSAKEAIKNVRSMFPDDKIIFANGGDRTLENIPEMDTADTNIEFVFGVGGEDKKNSSSWILQEWKAPKTNRLWGYYRVLHEAPGCKVKELTIEPGKGISLQRHTYRHEFWHVAEGACIVEQRMPSGYVLPSKELVKHQQISIPVNDWHRVYNPYDIPCRIVEIQYGNQCIEEDIERL
jgi:cytidyltransferase-like protein